MGRVPEGMESYRRRAALAFASDCHVRMTIRMHRKRHDAEQRDYLAALGVTPGRLPYRVAAKDGWHRRSTPPMRRRSRRNGRGAIPSWW